MDRKALDRWTYRHDTDGQIYPRQIIKQTLERQKLDRWTLDRSTIDRWTDRHQTDGRINNRQINTEQYGHVDRYTACKVDIQIKYKSTINANSD